MAESKKTKNPIEMVIVETTSEAIVYYFPPTNHFECVIEANIDGKKCRLGFSEVQIEELE